MSKNCVRSLRRLGISVVVVAAGACGADAGRGGTVLISAQAEPDVLFPPTMRSQVGREIGDLVFDRLADISPGLTSLGDSGWMPRLAQRWTWNADSSAVTFSLHPRARWHDSTPVTARDVQFTYSVYTDPAVAANSGAEMSAAVDSISVGDDHTCTAWFKTRSPERFYALVFNLAVLPQHILGAVPRDSLRTSAFTKQPLGSGPYRFVRWDVKQRVEIAVVDDYYRGRGRPDRVIWSIAGAGTAAAQSVFAGSADFVLPLSPPEFTEALKRTDMRRVRMAPNAYGYALFNTRNERGNEPHPVFGDRETRRALTMAVDRASVTRNMFDTLAHVALGPFTRLQWTADSTLIQIPFDRAEAVRILDSLGWRAGAGGVRMRRGMPLAFTILAPSSSGVRQRMSVLLQEQWRQVGARVEVEVLEQGPMTTKMFSGKFDVAALSIGTSPSPAGLRQAWSTAAMGMSNGLNVARYSNAMVDAQIDSAIASPARASAKAHYRAAYQAIVDDAPALWMFEPIVYAGVSSRLDVSAIRTDAWWMSIPAWRVTAVDSTTR